MNEPFTTIAQKYLAQLQLLAASMALIAAVCGVVLFLVWRKSGIPRNLVGQQRLVRIPWDWLEVFIACLLFIFVLEAAVKTIPWGRHQLSADAYTVTQLSTLPEVFTPLTDGGFYSRFSVGIIHAIGAIELAPYELARQTDDARTTMVYLIILFPILLVFFLNLMNKLAGARWYQMGLHLNRWKENFTLGTLFWALVTPVCMIILMIVMLDFWDTLWGRKLPHPMQVLLSQDTRVTTWILVALMTCVIAPLKEELLIRGVMQPYLMRNPLTSDVLVVLSMIWAFTILMTPGTGPDRGMGMGPLLFVAFVAPGYYLFEKWTAPWITEPGAARGIFATSLFFAALHATAWPTPIPLFLFSLAAGFLAYRTRSLIGPITLHCLFNLTSMIMMLLEAYPKLK